MSLIQKILFGNAKPLKKPNPKKPKPKKMKPIQKIDPFKNQVALTNDDGTFRVWTRDYTNTKKPRTLCYSFVELDPNYFTGTGYKVQGIPSKTVPILRIDNEYNGTSIEIIKTDKELFVRDTSKYPNTPLSVNDPDKGLAFKIISTDNIMYSNHEDFSYELNTKHLRKEIKKYEKIFDEITKKLVTKSLEKKVKSLQALTKTVYE